MWTRKSVKGKGKVAFLGNFWKCVLVAIILGIVLGTAGGSGASDYKRALIKKKKHPENKNVESDLKRLESFFYSSWYEMLTDLEPSYLLRKMKELVDEKYGKK